MNDINKIREARLKAGLTQQELCDRYGIPLRSLQGWESSSPKSSRKPPEYVVNLLLRCLDYDFSLKEGPQSAPEVLSAPKQLIFLDNIGRPIKEPKLSAIKQAYDDKKVQDLGNNTVDDEGNYRPDPKGNLYLVTEPENYGLDMGQTFYAKEV